jgi:superfamily II DNA/RNA helicase
MSGKDVMGGAQTGTGKTAGFTLPLLQRLAAMPAVRPRPPAIRYACADPGADARTGDAGA